MKPFLIWNQPTVVILLKATKHAERVQINKSHWLNKVSRAHFIGSFGAQLAHFIESDFQNIIF